jgi:hypothetical protein
LKKNLPYILGALALAVLLALLFSAPKSKTKRFDERITFRQKDKIPYGTFVAAELLQHMFPKAAISIDKKDPGNWDRISTTGTNQVVFLMARSFEPEEYELSRLADFVHRGNYVFIIAKSLSYEAAKYFNVNDNERFFYLTSEDSLSLSLNEKYFQTADTFIYPGKKFDSYFTSIDSTKTLSLGKDLNGSANFLQLQAGSGKLFLHLAPMAFTNYFILHKNNIQYFQKALSVIPEDVDQVLWNEYYLTQHKQQKEEEPGVLRVLWQYPSFRWGLLTAIGTLLLFVLLEMRRKQRFIPNWSKPKNDSLDFIRTIGRLYYDKKDHHNLARKMSSHFLDHVRSRYKMATEDLDKNFVQELQLKSNYPANDIEKIVDDIRYVNEGVVSEHQLVSFYHRLEAFYKNT